MLVSQVRVQYVCPTCHGKVSTYHLQGFCQLDRIRERYWSRCSKCGVEMVIEHASGARIKNEGNINPRSTGGFHG